MPVGLRTSATDSVPSPALRADAPTSLLTAQWCARQGWPVHPLAPGRKTPAASCRGCREPGHTRDRCSCLVSGRWCHGFHAATLDQRRIQQWWGRNPRFGVGVACGASGLVVIDIDAHCTTLPERNRLLPGIVIGDGVDLRGLETGFHTLGVLAALRGVPSPAEDEATLRVRTPSGGLHVWYRAGGSRHWQCSSGSSPGRALAWQVDVRAHGGYIVAPGTTTTPGTYTAVGSVRHPRALPDWLGQELQRTGHLPAPRLPVPRQVPPRAQQAVYAAGGGHDRTRQTLVSLLAPVEACGRVPEGAGFSDILNRAAFTLGGLVAAGRLEHEEGAALLQKTAVAARPGQERRVCQIIRSGMAAGLKRPLHAGNRP